MNTIITYKITQEHKLTSKAATVFHCLAHHSNKNNEAWPKLKTIAKETMLSVRTVQRALDELLEIGLITKKHNYREDGSQTSNIYKIILEAEKRVEAAKENAMLKLRDMRKRLEAKKERTKQTVIDIPAAAASASVEPEAEKNAPMTLISLFSNLKMSFFGNLARGLVKSATLELNI